MGWGEVEKNFKAERHQGQENNFWLNTEFFSHVTLGQNRQ